MNDDTIAGGAMRELVCARTMRFAARVVQAVRQARQRLHNFHGAHTIPVVLRSVQFLNGDKDMYANISGSNRRCPYAQVRIPLQDIQRRISIQVYSSGTCPGPKRGTRQPWNVRGVVMPLRALIRAALASRDEGILSGGGAMDFDFELHGGGGVRRHPCEYTLDMAAGMAGQAQRAVARLHQTRGAKRGAIQLHSLRARQGVYTDKNLYAILSTAGQQQCPFALMPVSMSRFNTAGPTRIFTRSKCPRKVESSRGVPKAYRKLAAAMRTIIRGVL